MATDINDVEFQLIKETLLQNTCTSWGIETSSDLSIQVNNLSDVCKQEFVANLNKDLASQAHAETLFTLDDYWLTEDVVGNRSYTLDVDVTITQSEQCNGLMKLSLSFWRMKGRWYCSIDLNLIAVLSACRERGIGKILVEEGITRYVNPLIIRCFSQLTREGIQLDLVFQADYLNPASKKLGELAYELLEEIDIELSTRSYLVDMSSE
ncbi:hypothetical protein [Thaumasiovibrio subtropicus]|uniref:hypothetical protein n=1 Tax=Thaumasiovibrio subtropicus TaxID=1891207 RepID=UPI000B35B988|nr:hypothetical protein [Thaumasiovibrio subtropicus]